MAMKLVREPSDTPNITNRDDARMIRYAYGGRTGIVKEYGTEIEATFSGDTVHIGSGRIVVEGWEVDIDEAGVDLRVEDLSGTVFYAALLEVNLTTETASYTLTSSPSDYPDYSEGDNLTTYPNGIRRVETHRFKATEGVITSVEKSTPVLPYYTDEVKRIDESLSGINYRLNTLGFRRGSISLIGKDCRLIGGTLTREGFRVLLESARIVRQGLDDLGAFTIVVPLPFALSASEETTITAWGKYLGSTSWVQVPLTFSGVMQGTSLDCRASVNGIGFEEIALYNVGWRMN